MQLSSNIDGIGYTSDGLALQKGGLEKLKELTQELEKEGRMLADRGRGEDHKLWGRKKKKLTGKHCLRRGKKSERSKKEGNKKS